MKSTVTLLTICGFMLAAASLLFGQENPNGVYVERSSAPAQKNPFDTPQDAQMGRKTFVTDGGCAYCHANDGTGGRGANLTLGEYRFGGSDAQLFETIRNGIPGSDMPPTRGPDEEIWRLAAFVKRLGRATPLRPPAMQQARRRKSSPYGSEWKSTAGAAEDQRRKAHLVTICD